MATMTINNNNIFVASHTITNNNINPSFTFNTQNTFVDKNIQVNITTPLGQLKSNAGVVSATSTNVTGTLQNSQPSSGYYISVSGSGYTGVQTAGWISPSATQISNIDTKYFTIPTATFETIDNQVKVKSSGYIPNNTIVSSISPGNLANVPTNNVTYTELTTPVVNISDGYLYINPGYFSGSKISLGTLLPNSSSTTPVTANSMLSGYRAFDENGHEIIGTIQPKSSSDLSASGATVYVAAGFYGTTASASIANGSASTPNTTIAKAPTITIATATGVITSKYSNSQNITPTVVAGYIATGSPGTVSTTGSNTLTLDPPTISVSGKTITIQPGWVCSTTAYNVATTSMSYTNTSVSSNGAVTRGNASWGTGWISAGNVGAATFANIPTTATTYIDISNTNSAPVLTAEGNLYINKGYTDNLVISLAKLIPDTANVSSSNQILNGVTVFDKNGKLWTGNIQTKTSSDLTANGKTVTVPAGYYASSYTKNVQDGTASVPNTIITQGPTISVSANGYVVANYNKTQTITPVINAGYVSTGTSGNVTINGTATYELGQSEISTTSVIPGVQQSVYVTPGYRAATATVTVKAASEGTSASITYSGGGLTANNKSFTPTVEIGSGTDTNMSNITIGAANTASYAYYFRVYATATSGSMYPTVTRADYKDTRTAGYLAARGATTILSSATCTATAVVNASNAGTGTYVSIKGATLTTNVSGGTVTCAVQNLTSCTATTTDTYNSGIAIKFRGSRAAATATATITAGYSPGQTKYASIAAGTGDSSTYYLQSVKLVAPPSGTTRTFDIIVPNGNTTDYITFQFTVDSSGNVTVTGV